MLPSLLPLFPLPNVVLFPEVSLPLHIFEPRYREMLADALEGERLIGMVLLKAGHEAEYEGCPPVYAVGCAGLITHAERLPDGCSNIVLQGLEKFRVVAEQDGRAYRRAQVEPLAEWASARAREPLRGARRRLEALVAPLVERAGAELKIPATISDEELVNALAQYLPFEAVEKQALLEQDGVLARCEALIDLLEMKQILTSRCQSSAFRH
jgi:Lon protease-like protein